MPGTVASRVDDYIDRVRSVSGVVREHADSAEREGRLAQPVVESLHDAGLFAMRLPVEHGGGGLTARESMPVCEEMARIDGSTGWTLTILSGGPGFAANLSPEARGEIFGSPRLLAAGSLNPLNVRALPVEGGYRFSGRATYCSGCHHADWLMAAALVLSNGMPQFVDGVPVMCIGFLPMSEATILPTWNVSGMCGTGSNDVAFDDVFVPERFTMGIGDALASVGDGLVAVVLGIARHALDAFAGAAAAKVPLASRSVLREKPVAQWTYGEAEGYLRAGRSLFYEQADETALEPPVTNEVRALRRLAAVTAAQFSARSVDLVYGALGASAIYCSGPLERCWRDVNAARQHITLTSNRYEIVGRVLLGLEPDSPLI